MCDLTLFDEVFKSSRFCVVFSGEAAVAAVIDGWQQVIDYVNLECGWIVHYDGGDWLDEWDPHDLDSWTRDDGNRLFRFSTDVGEMSCVAIYVINELMSNDTREARAREERRVAAMARR